MTPFLFFGKETLVTSHFQEKLEHLSFEKNIIVPCT